MAYEKDDYDMEKIPDYAMQPAREDIDTFDPAVYEKLFSELAPLEQAEADADAVAQAEAEDVLTGLFTGAFPGQAAAAAADPVQSEAGSEADPTQSEIEAETGSAQSEGGSEPEVRSENPAGSKTKREAEPDIEPEAAIEQGIEPAAEPVLELEPEAKTEPEPELAPAAKIIPVGSDVISNHLNLTDIRRLPGVKLVVEEDILVPDVKPDLASILSMEAAVKLSERQIATGAQGTEQLKLTGDLMVCTLYQPDRNGEDGAVIAIESRIPFKEESEVRTAACSELELSATVEEIDFSVVNERKFKIKATVAIAMKEYRQLNLELFEGVRGEEVQMLSETIRMTDVALRKRDTLEITEELPLKDAESKAGKILCCDVNVVENHKQITGEKAVISGTAYVNAMYLPEKKAADMEESREEAPRREPALFQGKVDFTQFIKLSDSETAELAGQSFSGSKACFRVEKAELVPSENEENGSACFTLNLNLETTLELYKDVETNVVTDIYHHLKEMRYDTQEVSVMNLKGSGVSEISVREIVNIPENYGAVERVAFLTGRVTNVSQTLEPGKSITEGAVSLSLICTAADEDHTAFSIRKEAPFRSIIDIPGVQSGMDMDGDILLKELWCDKINNRQIEINVSLLVRATVYDREKHPLVGNVSFVELPEPTGNEPGMILCITQEGDNVWRIAKKYRTTIDNIRKINGISEGSELRPGTRLLIVK